LDRKSFTGLNAGGENAVPIYVLIDTAKFKAIVLEVILRHDSPPLQSIRSIALPNSCHGFPVQDVQHKKSGGRFRPPPISTHLPKS
jgi:hypothetical protein